MIKKLNQKIFLIIMLSLSIVIIGIIILFAILNYNNTLKTSTLMLNRFTNNEPKNEKVEVDGVYTYTFENNLIVKSTDSTNNTLIKQYAIKINKNKNDSGIIGNYIYKVKKEKTQTIVTLMENKNVIKHIKVIVIYAVFACIVSLSIIYGIAKKISKVIVKPIEETFEKQKQFISDASHELKTPLAVIEANTDVLENEIGNNKWLKYIQNEAESMNKLINELLLLAKIENIDNLKERNNFDMSKETEIIVSMFESMAYEKKVILKSNIQKNIVINGNREDLEHILSTLIDNAIKHTDESNEVVVDLYKEKNNIILQVKNMGEKIPEDEKEKIFERFYRIDKSRNRNEKRYGLGLAIAKSIVDKYNGKIDVLYKDNFTVFKITIIS